MEEPKIIADRICLPSPMHLVKIGMDYFLLKEYYLALQRQILDDIINHERTI